MLYWWGDCDYLLVSIILNVSYRLFLAHHVFLLLVTQSTGPAWTFESSPTLTVVDDTTLTLNWIPAIPSQTTSSTDASVVYLLLWRTEGNAIWRKAVMTTNDFTNISGAHAQYVGLEFMLAVVNPSGIVVHARPAYPPPGYEKPGKYSMVN